MKSKFYYLAFSLFIFSSCKKGSPSWDVDMLAPLINSKLTINNIIPDSLTHKNPDNSLDLVITTPLYSLNADSLFKIRDTTLVNNYFAPGTTTIAPGNSIIPVVSNNIKYSLKDVELHTATIRSGKMLLTIQSGIMGKVDFNYTIPCMKDAQGNIFDTTVTIPAAASASSPGIFSGWFDLSGYKVDLTGSAGTSFNTMITNYSAIVTPASKGGYATTINSGDNVKISNAFDKIIMQYAKGYFGSSVTTAFDSTKVSLFNHIISGNLNLEDVDIDFSIENSIGADARITIDNLTSINSRTGNSVPLTHPIMGSPINLNRAVDNNGNVSSSLYKFSIKPSSPSNILQFIDNLPDKMSYKIDLQINPLGNVSGSNDFVYYNKLMKTEMNMTIPLSLIANDLTLADTMNFSMGKETDGVNHGNLYLYADNGFPFSAEAQLFLMDKNFSITDSLVSAPNVILYPALDGNNICIGTQVTKITIPADEKKMSELRAAKNLYLKIKFNTANQPSYVKIYSFYSMNVKLVGDFNFTVNKK